MVRKLKLFMMILGFGKFQHIENPNIHINTNNSIGPSQPFRLILMMTKDPDLNHNTAMKDQEMKDQDLNIMMKDQDHNTAMKDQDHNTVMKDQEMKDQDLNTEMKDQEMKDQDHNTVMKDQDVNTAMEAK